MQAEWDVRRRERDGDMIFNKDTVRGFSPRVPGQSNLVDCGIFLLHYVEMFFKVDNIVSNSLFSLEASEKLHTGVFSE